MRLRIKFRKYGPVRYTGHLDVMRFFQKAIRRAQIDVVYTNGFSPHQVMAFAAPLGVGLTSNGEYMDIEVHSIVSCQDVLERLNAASVPGIEVISVKVLPEGAGNAMASVAAAAYTVRFREGREPVTDIRAALPAFLARKEILITKETKKGAREVDIRPGIYQLTMEEHSMEEGHSMEEKHSMENEAFMERHRSVTIHMLVDASSGGNIKPVQVIEALLAEHEERLQENALIITREEVYMEEERPMEERHSMDIGTSERILVALDEIGTVC